MDITYILWSIRMGAWLTSSGTGTSNASEANVYSKSAIPAMLDRHRQHDGTEGLLPVERHFIVKDTK